jgi:hypothetical protein
MNTGLSSWSLMMWQEHAWEGLIFGAADALIFLGSLAITACFEHRDASVSETIGTACRLCQRLQA